MTVDELVVTLDLDPRGFTEGQKKALESFNKAQNEIDSKLKNLESRNKAAAHSFGDMTSAAEGLFTVLAGTGMAAFAIQTMNSAAATGRMAVNAGVATAEMSAFGNMIERVGGNSEAAQANLVQLQQTLQRAKWGDVSSEFLLGLSQVGGGIEDSPLALFFKLSQFANTHSAQETNLTASRLGLSQEVANEALKGSTQALKDFKAASDAALSPEQRDKLTAMQDAWKGMGQEISSVGRDVETAVAPALTGMMKTISEFVKNNRALADSLGGILVAITALSALKPALWVLRLLGIATPTGAAVTVSAGAAAAITGAIMPAEKAKAWNEAYPTLGKIDAFFGLGTGTAAAPSASAVGPGGAGRASAAEREAWIRATATALHIDPNIAMEVARREGFYNFQSSVINKKGQRETSYGDFQAFVGGGLGDEFKKKTGLDPSDPKNERKLDEFILKHVQRHGWDPNGGGMHGATNAGIGNWQGITIENVNVTAPAGTDPKQFGRAIGDGINAKLASTLANNSNTGQRQ